MPEFLLELYSEKIPPQLQINARTQLKQQLENSFEEERIQHKGCLEYSSPTRLSIYIKGVPQKIKITEVNAVASHHKKSVNKSPA